jgi:hypothetical protein
MSLTRKLHSLGGIITAVWLLTLGTYALIRWRDFAGLEPNAVGDFFAGAFAPLAFLWLVLGFFQQGEELRNSAQALRMQGEELRNSAKALRVQGEELRNSVEQQRELVAVTREQLKFDTELIKLQQEEIERSVQPVLEITSAGSTGSGQGNRLYHFEFSNYGKPCTDIRVVFVPKRPAVKFPKLDAGSSATFSIEVAHNERKAMALRVFYLDARLRAGKQEFWIAPDEAGFAVSRGGFQVGHDTPRA